jgi:hypothetical protein
MKTYLLAAAAVMLVAGNASAQNLVKNGGFEQSSVDGSRQFKGNQVNDWVNPSFDPATHYTGYGYNFLIQGDGPDGDGFYSLNNDHDHIYGQLGNTAMTVTNNMGTYTNNLSAIGYSGADFDKHGYNYLLLDGDVNYHGAVSQDITGLEVGKLYTVSFDWAGVTWFTQAGQTTQRFDVSLGGETQSTETLTVAPKGFSGWKTASLNFTATGTTQKLSFLAQGTPTGLPLALLLDNVSLTGAVPEPGTWMTMILGLGVVGAAMRRRKSSDRTRTQLV